MALDSAATAMRRRFAVVAFVVISVIIAAHLSEVRLGALFDSHGTASAWALLEGFANPELSGDFLTRIAKLSLESLFIGILGTVLATALGFTLAIVAIRVPRLPDPPRGSPVTHWGGEAIRLVVRFVLGVFRSIPDIVWAYLFVRLVGLGPGPAVLAIAVSTGGIIGKLFAELAEATDPDPIHALRRAGVGRFGILLHGILPQVRRQWVGYALFRLECSIRSASILGVVGAGGLGTEIALSVRYFEYDKLATALLAVLAYVVAFELLSALLRRRPVKWTLWAALAGTVASLAYLEIPWSDLLGTSFLPESIAFTSSPEFVRHAVVATFETVAMAWCATAWAAAVAFFVAPLACGPLTISSFRQEAPRAGGIRRRLWWGVFLLARVFFQICRAMPELTLAFIFIVWVGPGPFAGVLAVGLHTVGVLGRLYTDVYEEVERGPVGALEATGASRLGVWLYGVVPQVAPRTLAFTLYRFEVNIRATAMVGFIGAGGIGDSIHTAISLFHMGDLVTLLAVILVVVTVLDWIGDRARSRILTARFGARDFKVRQRLNLKRVWRAEDFLAPPLTTRSHERRPVWRPVFFRRPTEDKMESGYASTVSAGGLFICTGSPYPKGMVIEVIVVPPDAKFEEELEICMGRVAYTTGSPEQGMGVQLLDANPTFLGLLGVPPEPEGSGRRSRSDTGADAAVAPAQGAEDSVEVKG